MASQRLSNSNSESQTMYVEADLVTTRYQNLRKHLPLPNNPISIKCKFGAEVRRVTVHTVPTYDELLFLVHRLFRSMLSSNLNNLILKYIDEDYDLVSVTDDLDINHAIALSPNLKLLIFDKETRPFSDYIPKPVAVQASAMEAISLKQEIAHLSSKLEALLAHVERTNAEEKANAAPKTLSASELDEFVGKTSDPKPNPTEAPAEALAKPTVTYPPTQGLPGVQTYTPYHPPSRYQQHYANPPTNSHPTQPYSSTYVPTQPLPSQYPPSTPNYPHHVPQNSNATYSAPYPSSMAPNSHSAYYPSAPGPHYT
ncbi:hypothetical protein DSO57_1019858 [Entomophthora muscae]|uniref:Uncharacterized protein n=1 Tax=Entomophthora muscae TaxID=34485 RepID=A0ACC2SGS8_9FUNG|nr:hypothetical protein DSO57_1019858 [Entomophthora muscae]